MTPSAQIDTPETCKAISLPGVNAIVFTPETAGLDAAGRQATGLGLPAESARHNKQQTPVVGVEAMRSACRMSRSATKKIFTHVGSYVQ